MAYKVPDLCDRTSVHPADYQVKPLSLESVESVGGCFFVVDAWSHPVVALFVCVGSTNPAHGLDSLQIDSYGHSTPRLMDM